MLSPMDYCIETIELTRTFERVTAVDHLTMRVPRGSFFGFLGPNGAGKSTTIRMLTGMLYPSSGQALVLGMDVVRRPLEVKRRIGVAPEDSALFENLTAVEYLGFVGRIHGLPRPVIRSRIEELLMLTALEKAADTPVFEYSQGMRKKLSLCAALIHDPEIIFLDEPFEGLDAIASKTLRQVLEQATSRGRTVFLTSHILQIVERLCNYVGILNRGRLAALGTMAEITARSGLEEVFVETAGAGEEVPHLSWLEA